MNIAWACVFLGLIVKHSWLIGKYPCLFDFFVCLFACFWNRRWKKRMRFYCHHLPVSYTDMQVSEHGIL